MAGIEQNLYLPPLPAGYQYVKELASGAQGTVWLVLNRNMGDPGRQEAAKLLRQMGEKEQHRFFREISTLANLNHPNIVTIYYANPKESYFIMEYLAGGSVAQYLKQKNFTLSDGLRVLQQVAEGLDFAHGKQLIHRDLKPANILFSTSLVPKITDFGLAKAKDADEEGITAPQISLGTPHYMSPEQWENSQVVDQRADIWSLGIILYQMLTGRTPFHGLSDANLMYAVLMKPIPLPQKVNPKLSPLGRMAEAICLKALQKKTEHRYQRAAEMAQALAETLQQQKGNTVAANNDKAPMPIWNEEVIDTETCIDKNAVKVTQQANNSPAFNDLLPFQDADTPEVEATPQENNSLTFQDADTPEYPAREKPGDDKPALPAFLQNCSATWLVRAYLWRKWIALSGFLLLLLLGVWLYFAPPSIEKLRNDIVRGSDEQRMRALQMLEQYGNEAIPLVILALNIQNFTLRKQAKQILKKWGNEVFPALIAVVEDDTGEYNVDAKIEAIQILGAAAVEDAKRAVYAIAISSKAPDSLRQAAIESLLSIAPQYRKYYHCEDGVWYATSELEKKGYVKVQNSWQPLAKLLERTQKQLTAAQNKWRLMNQGEWKKKAYILPSVEGILPFLALSWEDCYQSYRIDSLLEEFRTQETDNVRVQAALLALREQSASGVCNLAKLLKEVAQDLEPAKPAYAQEFYTHAVRKCSEALKWQWSPERQETGKLQALSAELSPLIANLRRKLTADTRLWDVIYLQDGKIVQGLIEKESKDYIILLSWQENSDKSKMRREKIACVQITRIERLDPAVRQERLNAMQKEKR
jgi:serine/threonine protein kinase